MGGSTGTRLSVRVEKLILVSTRPAMLSTFLSSGDGMKSQRYGGPIDSSRMTTFCSGLYLYLYSFFL
jgi:hypothetical protein